MRCFFHLVNGREEILDRKGVDVTDLPGTVCLIHEAIADARRELALKIVVCDGWTLLVVAEDGSVLERFPLDLAA